MSSSTTWVFSTSNPLQEMDRGHLHLPALRRGAEAGRDDEEKLVLRGRRGRKRAEDYDDVENVIYLTVEQQKRLHYHIIDLLPWRHFGRKNIGFLYAIEHGAEVIYDTDDDNRLKVLDIPIWGPAEAEETTSSQSSQNSQLLGLSQYVEMKTYEGGDKWGSGSGVEYSARTHGSEVLPIVPRETVVNTYLDFKPSCGRRIWPRGFPLDNINDEHHPPLVPMNTTSAVFNFKPPAVQQFLADEDPDVDAIYRLTGKLPCVFEEKQHAITVPKGKFVPYNAQCVVNLKPAFWTLLLPVTVNGRVSDIWRSYIAQKLLWDIDEHVAFMPAHVIHDRVFHDYLKDFQSESDLYLKSTALVKFLAGWVSDAPTLVERIEQLYEQLYERGFVEEKDLKLSQAWIRDLLALGYKFPDLVIPKILPRGYGGTGSSARQEEL
eukprot:CAMPEP_0178994714 /NCGR_PEP_ID=MMETSP0795-20121207/7422_1 /TAXON_ID=88552 /ORGANISM="Amoebophrya sp., Strain Ameob2" /LENGTH=432 /DNA_ID=CAMNT_0020686935 /DNA_START=880 /DNA_END=2179 /DNA_ORIENTATION=-